MAKKKYTLTQCRLRRGDEVYTAWIETTFAKVGQIVSVLDELLGGPIDPKGYSAGWVVEEVFTTRPEKEVLERSRDHKNTRKASDI